MTDFKVDDIVMLIRASNGVTDTHIPMRITKISSNSVLARYLSFCKDKKWARPGNEEFDFILQNDALVKL